MKLHAKGSAKLVARSHLTGFPPREIKALPGNIPPIPFGVKKFVCSVEVDEALGHGAVSALCLRLIQAVVGTLDEVVDRLRSLKGDEAG